MFKWMKWKVIRKKKLEPKTKIGYTVNELAELHGMFPKEMESIVMELEEQGFVHCFWYPTKTDKTKLYVQFNSQSDVKQMQKMIEEVNMFG